MRWTLLLALGFIIYPNVSVAFANERLQVPRQPNTNVHAQSSRDPADDTPLNAPEAIPTRKYLSWEQSYQLLCQYKQVHGNCLVPQSQKPLGTFVNRQRIEYSRFMDPNSNKPTTMTSERRELLEKIGFVWDVVEHTWNIRYKELRQFRRENGHAVVPRSNGPLGAWTEKQRIEYKKYKALHETESTTDRPLSTTLTKERVEKLNEVGFVYDVREKQFEENVGALRIFSETKGHIDPRLMDGRLAIWFRKMKRQYRKYLQCQNVPSSNSTILSEQRVLALESVGFKPSMFNAPLEPVEKRRATWDSRYEELVLFKKAHGHCVVPKNFGSLGSWVRAQRHLMKKDKLLSQDRVELLEELEFVWDVHSWQWNQTYYELLKYKNEHGHTNVPMSQGALGLWVSNQRAHYNNYRQGKPSHMTQSRAEQLRSIGFEFYSGKKLMYASDEKWYLRFIELKRYKDVHGTYSVKRSSNPTLYDWCQHQKACYRKKLQGKKSTLKKSREEALQSIGFLDGITI